MPRTPAAGGRPSSVTVRAAPHRATFPKGKAMCSAHSTGEPRSGTNYFCARLHILLSGSFCVSLPQSFVAAKRQQNPALPPRRYPLTLRLRYLAFADGSGLPFSLHPPLAALESQTPQREPRALPRRTQIRRGGTAPQFARICRGAKRSITTPQSRRRRASSPCTGEPREPRVVPKTLAANLIQGSQGLRSIYPR